MKTVIEELIKHQSLITEQIKTIEQENPDVLFSRTNKLKPLKKKVERLIDTRNAIEMVLLQCYNHEIKGATKCMKK